MRDIYQKIRASEFLTSAEVLQLKVSLVMFFLLLFGVLTLPVTFIEEFTLTVAIVVPLTFLFLYMITFLFLVYGKARLAMHFSIYTFIALTVYYMGGWGHFYSYFLIFVTLTIIIFYQDITTYIIYGGGLTAFAIIFMQANPDAVLAQYMNGEALSILIRQAVLLAFFIVFLLYFFLSDSYLETVNNEIVRNHATISRTRGLILQRNEDLTYRKEIAPLYEDDSFENAVKRIAGIAVERRQGEHPERSKETEVNIEELVEYYFFLHHQNLESIKEKQSAPELALRYARAFEPYLLNRAEDMNELIYKVLSRCVPASPLIYRRYATHFNSMFKTRSYRIIALAILYRFLANEATKRDRWGKVDHILEHTEIKKLFKSPQIRTILDFEDVTFFLNHEHLFRAYLS